MRILFTTDHVTAASTVLNEANFRRLGEIEGVTIDVHRRDYANYDVVLFMGYDPRIAEARAAKATLKIGVVDPRNRESDLYADADFIIANGLEMEDWFAACCANIFVYSIFPALSPRPAAPRREGRIVLGYHGNQLHLANLSPQGVAAIETLAEDVEVELRAVYNIRELGPLPPGFITHPRVHLRCEQWTPDAYVEHLSDVDIGLVPGLVPGGQEELSARATSHYLTRFKFSSNPGRILVFAQLGIPVVADLYPSALQVIRHGENGFVARSAGGWYRALRQLAGSAELRERLGGRLREDCRPLTDVALLNRRLVAFLAGLVPGDRTRLGDLRARARALEEASVRPGEPARDVSTSFRWPWRR